MDDAIARPSSPEQHLATDAGEDGEATDELAARLQRIQAAASYAEGDVDSDSDTEQVGSDAHARQTPMRSAQHAWVSVIPIVLSYAVFHIQVTPYAR